MFIDNTGKPLTSDEIIRARNVVKKYMINISKLPYELAVEILTIKIALDELLDIKNTLENR